MELYDFEENEVLYFTDWMDWIQYFIFLRNASADNDKFNVREHRSKIEIRIFYASYGSIRSWGNDRELIYWIYRR